MAAGDGRPAGEGLVGEQSDDFRKGIARFFFKVLKGFDGVDYGVAVAVNENFLDKLEFRTI